MTLNSEYLNKSVHLFLLKLFFLKNFTKIYNYYYKFKESNLILLKSFTNEIKFLNESSTIKYDLKRIIKIYITLIVI